MMLLPLLALTALLAACGGGSKSATASATTTVPASTSSTTGSGPASATFAKYTQCLESHGVPASATGSFFGGGRRGGAGTGTGTSSTSTPGTTVPRTRPSIPAQYQAAFTACRSDLPTGGFGGARGGLNTAAFTAYRNCLEVHGVTLPTTPATTPGETRPTGNPGGAGGSGGGGFGATSPVLNTPAGKAAQQACASLLPARTGPTSTTTVAG